MVKSKIANDIVSKISNKAVIVVISAIFALSITPKFAYDLLDFIFFAPIVGFVVYAIIKILLHIVSKSLGYTYELEIDKSIPKRAIKEMLESRYIEVPKLSSNVEPSNEQIISDQQFKYLLEQEDRIKNQLISKIENIDVKNCKYYQELKEDIINNLSEDQSINSLYNMISSMVINGKINIMYNYQNEASLNAKTKFYQVIADMSQYNYAIDLEKYEKRRQALLKHVEYGNQLIKSFSQELFIKQKGYFGEESVEKEIKIYDDYITYLSNIRFEVDGISVETDGVIVCDKGVFALEIKNYGKAGDTIILRKDGKIIIRDKNKRERVLDVVQQHNRHCALKQKRINKELKELGIDHEYIIINPIIVIANNDVDIINESDIKILRASSVIHEILSTKENYLSKEIQKSIIEIVEKNKLPLKSYPVINIEEALSNTLTNISTGISYLSDVMNLNEEVYKLIDKNSYIDIEHMNIINKGIYDGKQNAFYQIVIDIKS